MWPNFCPIQGQKGPEKRASMGHNLHTPESTLDMPLSKFHVENVSRKPCKNKNVDHQKNSIEILKQIIEILIPQVFLENVFMHIWAKYRKGQEAIRFEKKIDGRRTDRRRMEGRATDGSAASDKLRWLFQRRS